MHTEIAKSKKELIYYFLHTEGDEVRSAQALADNFDMAMKQSLNAKELAIVLYHSASKANKGMYGEDIKSAHREIECRLQTWTDKALTQKNNFSSYTLSHMLCAFSLLELRPPQRLIDRSMELATDLIPNFSADDVSYFLDSLANLAIPLPKKEIGLLQKRMSSVTSGFSPDQAYKILHSMTVIDAVNEQHFGAGKASLSPLFAETIKDARFRAKLAEPEGLVQRNILSDSLLWFKGETPFPRVEQSDTSSLFEADVKQNLENVGAIVETEAYIAKLKHRVDLKSTFNDKSILIECDGPSHFIKSVDDQRVYLNGSTILQTALIQKFQADNHIVRIPHDIFYQHMNDTDFWESFLVNVDDAEPGAYLLDTHGLIALQAGKHSALQNE